MKFFVYTCKKTFSICMQRSDTDCILGSSIVIGRREISTCCRNGRDYVREHNYAICECNEEDFEWYIICSSYSPYQCHITLPKYTVFGPM